MVKRSRNNNEGKIPFGPRLLALRNVRGYSHANLAEARGTTGMCHFLLRNERRGCRPRISLLLWSALSESPPMNCSAATLRRSSQMH